MPTRAMPVNAKQRDASIGRAEGQGHSEACRALERQTDGMLVGSSPADPMGQKHDSQTADLHFGLLACSL